MPKKIDARVKERCVRLVLEHQGEYASLSAAAAAVARREGVGKESVRRWVIQAQIDGGQRQGRRARSSRGSTRASTATALFEQLDELGGE